MVQKLLGKSFLISSWIRNQFHNKPFAKNNQSGILLIKHLLTKFVMPIHISFFSGPIAFKTPLISSRAINYEFVLSSFENHKYHIDLYENRL
jgi:hypothetical protein